MIILTLLALFAGIVACGLGLTILFSSQKDHTRVPFFIFSFSMGAWAILIALFLLTSNQSIAQWVVAGYYVTALTLIYGFILYCLALYENEGRSARYRWMRTALLVPILGLAYIVVGTNQFIESVTLEGVHSVQLGGLWYGLYCLVFVIYSVIAFTLLLSVIRREKNEVRKAQRMLVAKVMSICLPAGAFFNLLLPLLGNYQLIMIGPIFALPIVIVVFYAVLRHKLFDVRGAVVRSVSYFIVLATLVGVYFGIALVISRFFNQSLTGTIDLTLSIGIALVLALAFQPIKHVFDVITNKIFYRDNYSSDDFFSHMSKVLSSTTDLRQLLQETSEEINQTMRAEFSFYFVRYSDNRFMQVGTEAFDRLKLQEVAVIDEFRRATSTDTLIIDTVPEDSEVYALMKQQNIIIIVPLSIGDGPSNYLFLGPQRSRQYTRRDIRLLETTANELMIAIQNSLSIQDVEEINATLQQRIDDATKELRASNDKLQRLDAAKDEFVSMASHQLRTPLTSVKGYIDMVLDGDVGKITDMQRKLLSEAFTSSERMVHLINDFLNVSRLQTGKFMIDRRQVDMAKLVAQEVSSLQTTAESRNLTLNYRPPSVFPVLYVDENKLRQVIMNFIDNAFFYSREHSTVTVTLKAVGGEAMLTVKDSGMGVPKSEQNNLFTKFFRATNARKQRPDGTGVGLFLAKKVIVAHGGSVIFESVEGKGSTFGFRLPVKKLSLPPADDADQLDN